MRLHYERYAHHHDVCGYDSHHPRRSKAKTSTSFGWNNSCHWISRTFPKLMDHQIAPVRNMATSRDNMTKARRD